MRSQWHDPAWRAEFRRGMQAILPTYPGIIAWGLVTGVAMVKSGLPLTYALFMTFTAYAGSAQLAALPLMAAGAPVWVIAVTALVTNLRFVIYAAAMRHLFTDYSLRRRAVLGYLGGDFSFVLLMERIARDGIFPHRDAWLFGATLPNWFAWQGASVTGMVAASFIPTSWGLQFAGTLALLALIVPQCRQFPAAAGALTAAVVALAGRPLPLNLGLLAGVVAGIAVATTAESAIRGRPVEAAE